MKMVTRTTATGDCNNASTDGQPRNGGDDKHEELRKDRQSDGGHDDMDDADADDDSEGDDGSRNLYSVVYCTV